jgi:hypothetical protein
MSGATSSPGRTRSVIGETGEVAYKRDFAVRLTLADERIVRVVVMPGSALGAPADSGSQAD